MSGFLRGCAEAWRLWVYLGVMLISAVIVREFNVRSDHIGETNEMVQALRDHPLKGGGE